MKKLEDLRFVLTFTFIMIEKLKEYFESKYTHFTMFYKKVEMSSSGFTRIMYSRLELPVHKMYVALVNRRKSSREF